MRNPEPPGLESLPASQVEWINSVCDQFEEDWERLKRPQILDYIKRVPEGDPDVRLVLLRELITSELELRQEEARAHDLDTYREIFTDPVETEVVEFILHDVARADVARRFRILGPHAEGGSVRSSWRRMDSSTARSCSRG